MDKVNGPSYFVGPLAKLAVLPKFTPMALPDTGRTNIVPVNFFVEAELLHTDGRDGQTFYLTASKPIGLQGLCRAVGKAATQLVISGETLDVADLAPTFTTTNTE
ncbi:MAG TPA: hypothetical protein VFK56_10545 [Mycobacterium sp.]|nr:hypothetical protein [Mycobacterium sp.]